MIKCYIKIVPVVFILLLSTACDDAKEVKQERYYPKSPVGVVNINTATTEELMYLPLIDTHKAQLIIKWRTRHPFKRVEEIIYVPLIGEYTYLHLRKYLIVKGKTTLKHDVLLANKKKKN